MFTWVVWYVPNIVTHQQEQGFLTFFGYSRTSRTSLALAFARIFPPNEPFRRFAIGMALLFGCNAIIELSVISSQKSSWTSFDSAESSLTSPMHIAGFVGQYTHDLPLDPELPFLNVNQSPSLSLKRRSFGGCSALRIQRCTALSSNTMSDIERVRIKRVHDPLVDGNNPVHFGT